MCGCAARPVYFSKTMESGRKNSPGISDDREPCSRPRAPSRKEKPMSQSIEPHTRGWAPAPAPGCLDVFRTGAVSYTHLRAHETGRNLVCRLLLEKKKKK